MQKEVEILSSAGRGPANANVKVFVPFFLCESGGSTATQAIHKEKFNVPIDVPIDDRLQNSRFRTFSEGAKRRKRDPRVGSARASHARRRVRRENDCRLFIQRIRSKRESFNVTEVTEIA